eukprot:15334147-Ditylum_brightwellii.AAC.1
MHIVYVKIYPKLELHLQGFPGVKKVRLPCPPVSDQSSCLHKFQGLGFACFAGPTCPFSTEHYPHNLFIDSLMLCYYFMTESRSSSVCIWDYPRQDYAVQRQPDHSIIK